MKTSSDIDRLPFQSTAQLFSGMECWETSVYSLSLQGVELDIPSSLSIKIGDIFRLNIPFEGARAIAMSIHVIEVDVDKFSAQWTQIDMDSFAILKRTIELNSITKDQVRQDIITLVEKS